jgi:hypothetical protein
MTFASRADCNLIYATRNPDKYDTKWSAELDEMKTAYEEFKTEGRVWNEYYAHAHCKINNFGAIYGNHKVHLSRYASEHVR